MATPIFLDLDGLLVRSYPLSEMERFPDRTDFVQLFNGIVTKKRPHVEHFLKIVSACGDLYLFTSAQPGYAKSALKSLNLAHYFQKFFSGVYHTKGTIANELNLYGRPWLLLDDSPFDHETVRHKLASLGAPDDPDTAFIDRHFIQVPSYLPHLQEADQALLPLADEVKERVRRLERRKILF